MQIQRFRVTLQLAILPQSPAGFEWRRHPARVVENCKKMPLVTNSIKPLLISCNIQLK